MLNKRSTSEIIHFNPFQLTLFITNEYLKTKGSPVYIVPTCAGSGKVSDHFGSYICSLSLFFHKRLFPELEPMTSCSQGNNFTTCAGFGEGSDHFGSYVRNLPCISARG
jgi:hypothetical protein